MRTTEIVLRSAWILPAIIGLQIRVNAQAPSGATAPASASAASVPAGHSSGIAVNYVRTREALGPITDAATFAAAGYSQVRQTTQYFDGLGRPVQTVVRQASPGLNDLVSPVVYDDFGREAYKYLPYIDTGSYGRFKLNAFGRQAVFMASQYPGESVYYSKTDFENSPLNRVTKTMAAGNSWAGADRGNTLQYKVNDASDSVRIWTIASDTLTGSNLDQSTNVPQSTSGQVYAPGTLYETHSADEEGSLVVEYKDKDGRIVLKKVQLSASPGNAHVGWLCTYYVYDDLGLLRFVIPPKAVQVLLNNSTWDLATGSYSIINELCFRYQYDGHKRMIAKKVPGAGWVYMVYDRKDRVVYTQDAKMRSGNKWFTTFYDELNRLVTTGMISYSNNRGALQWLLNARYDAASVTTVAVNFYAPDSLYVYEREQGRFYYKAVNKVVLMPGFESPIPDSFETELGEAVISTSNVLQNYDPLPPSHSFTALTVNYYDDYSFTSRSYHTADTSNIDHGGNANYEYLPASASLLTRSKPTGSKVRVLADPDALSTGAWMESVIFYDNKGRGVQTHTENFSNGADIVTTRYDFTGHAITVYDKHTNAIAAQTVKTKSNMLYDHGGRILHVKKTIDNDGSTTRYLTRNSYDASGQLSQKRMGQKNASDTSALEVLDHTYNIRGWLQGINRAYSRGTGTRWFGMELNYDWGFTTNLYNGNIAGQQWRSAGDGERRAYGYNYDPANRILSGDFTQFTSSAWNTSAGIDFSLSNMSYDPNGNILTMQQKGWKIGGSQNIDSLTYTYTSNSNKLLNVIDGKQDAATTLGDFRSSSTYMSALGGTKTSGATDYTYDDNGNLLKDLNKDIGNAAVNGIIYNHLNLPYRVWVKGKGTITYIYDAAGNKLQKRTVDSATSITTVTNYLGAYVYQNDTLQFMSHEEGRVRRNSENAFVYDYFVKDHLGNTRVVLTDERQTSPYPAVSLESGSFATDTFYYKINTANIIANPVSLPSTYANNNGNPPYNTNPNINTSATSAYMYKLNGASVDKTGLGITLKVMTGDTVSIFGKSFWHSNGGSPNNSYTTVVNDLLTALAGTSAIAGAGKGATAGALIGSSVTPTDVSTLLGTQPTTSDRPNAYINWILFDEQFRVVSGSSGFDPVNTSADALKSHSQSVNISKSGYLYVYVSNESNQDVFFDNLQVIHARGPLLQEEHFYPFGLTMAGISSKAAGKLENKKEKFQGQELDDDLGLNWYGFKWRNHDPQIGRFIQIDPLSDKYVHNSTYSFSENKVTNHVELEGLEAITAQPLTLDKAQRFFSAVGNVAGHTFALLMAPFNMVGDMHAAGNAKDPVRKAELEQSAKANAAQTVENIIGGAALGKAFKTLRGMASSEMSSARAALAEEWMGSKSKTQFVDMDKPVYTSTLDEGAELVQFRLNGNAGAMGDYYAPVGTTPQAIGLNPADVAETFSVTVNKATKVLNSTHTKNAAYYKDPSITLEGGGKQIFSKDLKNNATFTKQ